MPVKGEIQVRVSTGSAAAAAGWLRGELMSQIRMTDDTVLTPGHNARTRHELERLAAILSKVAARKRSVHTAFVINVPKLLAERFVSRAQYWSLPSAVAETLAAMRKATRSKRGRPRLTDGQRSDRVAFARTVDERHRKRLASRMRHDKIWREWFEQTQQRGETVLTATVQPPKI